MKQQDIDKKIGMPDVDKEWAQFERGVIDQKTTSRKPLYWGIGIAASIALVTGIFLLNHDAEKQQAIAHQTTNTTEIPTASDNKSAIVAAEEPVALPAKDEPVRMETEQRPRAELLAQAPTPSAEAKVYDCGEIMPQFPGGNRALMEFIKSNICYPDLAMEFGARGRVITTFTVDSLGYTSNYKVTKIMKLNYDTLRLSQESADRQQQLKQQIEQQLGEESLRILSLMPKWTPGNQFGHPVNVKYCVPVPFLATEEERQIFLVQRQNEEYLQDNILGLNIVPTNLETSHTIRITGTGDTQKKDSFVVVVNGEILPDSIRLGSSRWFAYINRQQQMINTFNIIKDDKSKEQIKARYGFLPSADAIIEITTTLDTLSEAYMQQHPELRTQRRRIEGYVTSDDGKPLADAWVSLSKYEQGTATDTSGHFIFWIPLTGKTLTVYSDGYETISDIQPSDTVLTIRMKPLINTIKTKEKGDILIRGAEPKS